MKAVLALILIAALAAAAPSPPEVIVNNRTMECSPYNAGDECTRCAIPDGWTSLGYGTVECPQGYAETRAPIVCTPAVNERCCSEGHSGANGDCGKMIINRRTKQCVFANGTAPSGWEGEANGTESWQCPEGYTWAENTGPCPVPFIVASGALVILLVRSTGCPCPKK